MTMSDVELAISAASAGGSVVRSKFGRPLARFHKASGDFATEADLEAEQAIFDLIRASRPVDGFLGEETGADGPGRADRTWLVDPLCGTLNFAAQTPLMAVNVAHRAAGDVRVSATADPIAEEVFWTDGLRAFVRRDCFDALLVPSPASHLVDVNLDGPDSDPTRLREPSVCWRTRRSMPHFGLESVPPRSR